MSGTLSSAQRSRAIGFARISLIVGLVFLHYGNFPESEITPFRGFDPHAHSFVTWLNSFVLFFFFSAVPLLSMISGWLFFSFPQEAGWSPLRHRIRKRFVTLYLPLVLWNLMYFAALYALFTVKPDMAGGMSNRFSFDFNQAGVLDYINAVFAVTDIPLAFQFWFVRDLFVTILISPLLWVWLREIPRVGLIALSVCWIMGYTAGVFHRPDVPFFFYCGALIRHQGWNFAVPLRVTLLLLLLYLLLAGLRALAPAVVDFGAENADNPFWIEVVNRLMRIPGVIACWGLIYRAAQTGWGGIIAAYGGLAFFLHSAHWPLLAVVKKIVWRVMPHDGDVWLLIHYLVSVSVTVAAGITLGLLLALLSPRLFALMNGGRPFRHNTIPLAREALG